MWKLISEVNLIMVFGDPMSKLRRYEAGGLMNNAVGWRPPLGGDAPVGNPASAPANLFKTHGRRAAEARSNHRCKTKFAL